MSTVVPLRAAAYRAPRLALLGTGVVGSALVARYQRLQSAGLALPPLAWLANSRALHDCAGAPQRALEEANGAAARRDDLPPWAEAEALHAGDIVIDATASDAVAGWHAEWLSRGVHVVTANKLGAGSGWSRAQAIAQACAASGARYGDAATVGAGLPLLRSLRALVAGGDRIHRVEGVLSGSLAWLFNHYDGMRPFSGFVRQARQAGYTEPDPRIDLSGEDVRRKLLILARSLSAALANGNTVVVKPSELTPLTTLALADILGQAGVPAGVVTVVTGGREYMNDSSPRANMFFARSFSLRVRLSCSARASTVMLVRGRAWTFHDSRVSSSSGLVAQPTFLRLRVVNSSVLTMIVAPRGTSARLALRAAGFIATSTSGASPGVRTSWSAKCSWNELTPGRVPCGARISAGKLGSVDRSLPSCAVSEVNRSPVSCMPSPESPAKRMMTRSRCWTLGVLM